MSALTVSMVFILAVMSVSAQMAQLSVIYQESAFLALLNTVIIALQLMFVLAARMITNFKEIIVSVHQERPSVTKQELV